MGGRGGGWWFTAAAVAVVAGKVHPFWTQVLSITQLRAVVLP